MQVEPAEVQVEKRPSPGEIGQTAGKSLLIETSRQALAFFNAICPSDGKISNVKKVGPAFSAEATFRNGESTTIYVTPQAIVESVISNMLPSMGISDDDSKEGTKAPWSRVGTFSETIKVGIAIKAQDFGLASFSELFSN